LRDCERIYICVCVHRIMTTRTLSVTDDVYKRLKRLKLKGESFSDTIRRLTERARVSECAGMWGDLTPEELKAIESAISETRRRSTAELIGRMDKR